MYNSSTTQAPITVGRPDPPPRTERSPYSVVLRALGTLLTLPSIDQDPQSDRAPPRGPEHGHD